MVKLLLYAICLLNYPPTILLPIKDGKISNYYGNKLINNDSSIFITPTYYFTVKSCSNGKIKKIIKCEDSCGYTIIISLNSFVYCYSGLEKILKLKEGQKILKGETLGELSHKPHTDPAFSFSIYLNKKPINPIPFLVYSSISRK